MNPSIHPQLRTRVKEAIDLPGHIKVRLSYTTLFPQHTRSHVLKDDFSAPPPYIEHVFVLVPAEQAYDRASAYADLFTRLKQDWIVANSDQLRKADLRIDDVHTIAYYEEEV